ncbi:MAG: GIY-YIG nuclease family protein [Prochloraceae cyanobacterium]|nr:GIY-YIG nuclease family protein [Prochloraceae cyanobacterium]
MIKPEKINLTTLPTLHLRDKEKLPEKSGIYFALDSLGIVQYIGKANNLKNRWNNHHRENQLKGLNDIKIAYLEVSDPSLLTEIEKSLINRFKPGLNGTIVVNKKTIRINISMTVEFYEKLKKYAEENERSISAQIRYSVEKEIHSTHK